MGEKQALSQTEKIEEGISQLKQELDREADKVVCICRQRRIRTLISAVVGGILFGTPTFIVYWEAGLFATLCGAFVGFSVIQLYFFLAPGQSSIGSIVRRHRNAEEEIARLSDELRWRLEKTNSEFSAVEVTPSADVCKKVNRKGRLDRK